MTIAVQIALVGLVAVGVVMAVAGVLRELLNAHVTWCVWQARRRRGRRRL